jgi:predicted NBD/HSP70 family sugar kinase
VSIVSASSVEGARPDDARRHNRTAVLRRLHVDGPCTRATLAAELGLNRSTIKAVVDGLAVSGLVAERLPAQRSGAGRPSLLVLPRPLAAVVASVDIRTDAVAVALVGLGGETLARLGWRLRRGPGTDTGTPPEVLTRIVESAQLLVEEAGVAPAAVGVSVPGVVRRADGLLRVAPNLGWAEVPIGERLTKALDTPVQVANDADLGALAEHTRGVARGVGDVVFVAGDVGVGGGVISGGVAQRGAAEMGHMVVRPGGRHCHCGACGCWETEIGAAALRRALDLAPGAGRGELVAELRALAEDPAAARTRLADLTAWLGLGLVNVVNLFAPELIVLGDLLAELPGCVLDDLDAHVGEHSLVGRAVGARVVRSALAPRDVQILGAAELAFAPILSAV